MSIAYRNRKKLRRLSESPEIRAVRNKIRAGVKGYYAFVLRRTRGGDRLERGWTLHWSHPGKRGQGKWNPRLTWRQIGFIWSLKQQEAQLADERK